MELHTPDTKDGRHLLETGDEQACSDALGTALRFIDDEQRQAH